MSGSLGSSGPLRIAFDVDGVLRNLVALTLKEYNELGKFRDCPVAEVTESDITYFDRLKEIFSPEGLGVGVGVSEKSKNLLIPFLDEHNIWRYSPCYREFCEFWNALARHSRRGKVFPLIVSANSGSCGMQQTLAWIHENLTRPTRGGWEVHFTNDKTTVRYDALIDDKYKNIEEAMEADKRFGTQTELFMPNRPWTREIDTQALLPAPDSAGIVRIEKWIARRMTP